MQASTSFREWTIKTKKQASKIVLQVTNDDQRKRHRWIGQSSVQN